MKICSETRPLLPPTASPAHPVFASWRDAELLARDNLPSPPARRQLDGESQPSYAVARLPSMRSG
ncbi:hypothetical protein LNP74_21030 [Klebsiella pneumoniae subsp. pneumoniae]|nr:hypothetical protein [Klebsiella pneumoniae subsp. pneumoniae]